MCQPDNEKTPAKQYNLAALVERAGDYQRQGKLAAAGEIYRRALAAAPDNAEIGFRFAKLLVHRLRALTSTVRNQRRAGAEVPRR